MFQEEIARGHALAPGDGVRLHNIIVFWIKKIF